ncbi:SPOSA6832_03401, partial [Sporobolomyces salmonicolor]
MFSEEIATLRRLGIRHVLTQALNFAMVLSTALMMWKGLSVICNTESPIVVVLRCVTSKEGRESTPADGTGVVLSLPAINSESMEPAIQVRDVLSFPSPESTLIPLDPPRGDLLFLTMPRTAPLQHGDITVYKVPGATIPIVHRVIEAHLEHNSTEQWLLTKGDNNHADDVGLYNGMRYLRRSHIVGKVQGYVPYVGYATILMNDYPKLKYALLAVLGGGILLHRE